LRRDGWWEVEMGRLRTGDETVDGEEVAVSFEVLGWHPKRGLIVEGVEFRPL
jgi:DNA-directed RNA polymerase subunit E'/Rpb7